MKPPKDLHGLYLQKLQKSDPIAYNTAMCKIIQAKTKEIILPNLTKEEMQHLKKHLEDYEKIKGKDIETKFLNLRNAFLIVNEMEKNTEARHLINPIIRHLYSYQYVFDLITQSLNKEGKKNQLLEHAINYLNFDINLFIIKYGFLTSDTDTTGLDLQPLQTQNEAP